MKSMHRAHPDLDWKKMNAETRKMRTDKVQDLRKSLTTSGNWNPENKQIENISRDISGYWQERGSNNLAGRILTADIDMSVSLFQINIWLQKKLINKEHFVYIASRTHEKSIVKRNLFRNILGVIMRFFTFGILDFKYFFNK